MILKKGQKAFKLPERIESYGAELGLFSGGDPEKNPHSVLYIVKQITLGDYVEMLVKSKTEVLGFPAFFAISHDADGIDRLLPWPIPSGEIHASFTYFPARKRI